MGWLYLGCNEQGEGGTLQETVLFSFRLASTNQYAAAPVNCWCTKAYCGLANYIYSGSYLFIRKTANGYNIEFINEISKTVLSKALDLPELLSKIEELQKTSQNMEKSLDSKSGIVNLGILK